MIFGAHVMLYSKNADAAFAEVPEARWGFIVKTRLPGGSDIGLYQPKHAMALERR